MRRGIRRRRVRSRRKGYDWIVTTGDQFITLLAPSSDSTIAEFPLVTPTEVAEIGSPLLVHRVVGTCWLFGPSRSGEINGAAQVAMGIRVATTDASGGLLYLPIDALSDTGMDAPWMFLRHYVMGNLGVPAFQSLPLNLFPNVAPGGRHAPQGGPAIDINTKRRMSDTEVLSLNVSINTLPAWSGTPPTLVEDYTTGDAFGVALHIRTLVCAAGR